MWPSRIATRIFCHAKAILTSYIVQGTHRWKWKFGMTGYSDRELVALLKRCDTKAFDEVFERYRARLYSFLVRLSGSRDVAEDLLQETWIRLATRVSSLREDEKLAPWLFTVARNLYCSHRRSKRLAIRSIFEFSRRAADREPIDSPFDILAQDEHEKLIENAVVALPPRYREALLLVSVEGLTPSEAAVVCHLDPATLRKRLSRARAVIVETLRKASLDKDRSVGAPDRRSRKTEALS